jgi:hypothetical protein
MPIELGKKEVDGDGSNEGVQRAGSFTYSVKNLVSCETALPPLCSSAIAWAIASSQIDESAISRLSGFLTEEVNESVIAAAAIAIPLHLGTTRRGITEEQKSSILFLWRVSGNCRSF